MSISNPQLIHPGTGADSVREYQYRRRYRHYTRPIFRITTSNKNIECTYRPRDPRSMFANEKLSILALDHPNRCTEYLPFAWLSAPIASKFAISSREGIIGKKGFESECEEKFLFTQNNLWSSNESWRTSRGVWIQNCGLPETATVGGGL